MNFIYAFCSFIFYFNASFIKNDIEMIMTTIQNILSRIRNICKDVEKMLRKTGVSEKEYLDGVRSEVLLQRIPRRKKGRGIEMHYHSTFY